MDSSVYVLVSFSSVSLSLFGVTSDPCILLNSHLFFVSSSQHYGTVQVWLNIELDLFLTRIDIFKCTIICI